MPAHPPRSRYYVHGDVQEGNLVRYYCAKCDLFVPLEHFDEASHLARRAEWFNHSMEAWRRQSKRRGTDCSRPGNAENVLAAAAALDETNAKAKRNAFYRWLLRQTERDDPIGDFSRDAQLDHKFPVSSHELDTLRRYLHRHHAPAEAIVALDEAWSEFKSGGKIRVGLSVTQRFAVFKRDQYRCQICGLSAQDGKRLEVDHKVPVAKGGSNEPKNLWTLCCDCNRGKSDEDL